MAISITDLAVTEGYADGTILTFAQLTAAMTSIESGLNTRGFRNIEQIAKDCFPEASYTLDSDGAKNITSTLWDKQVVQDDFGGGDISIETTTDSGFEDVNAVDIVLYITPELPGKYKATFNFVHEVTSTATTLMAAKTAFRLTDGSDASGPQYSGATLAATASGSSVYRSIITLVHIFNFTTTTEKTIKLQKYNSVMTGVSSNTVNANATSGWIYMMVEKI